MFTHEQAMLPILRLLADGHCRSRRELELAMGDHFGLSDAERQAMLPSGTRAVFANRAGWALSFLKKAGFVSQPKRGSYQITDEGRRVATSDLLELDFGSLRERSASFDEWVEQCRRGRQAGDGMPSESGSASSVPVGLEEGSTPEETMERAHSTLKSTLSTEILEAMAACSPAFFERLVIRLLVKMGYGGSFEDAARSIGRSGDEGIDGIIKEDRLGLDVIYVQAKRWQGSVGRPQVQSFIGALTGQRARKGVCITTSTFTREAIDYVRHLDHKVVLIDGETLARYMIETGLGVTLVQTYEVKRLDSDFFEG